MENQLEIYQSIIEDAVDSIFIGDNNGNLIFVNKAAEELTGYTKNELLSSNISLLFPDEQLKIQPLRYAALNSGLVVTTERDILTKTGGLVPVEMNSKKLDSGNLQSFMRDISQRKKKDKELKESEEKYKILFESSPSGILFATSDGTIINANHAITDILGYAENELVGKNVSSLSHPDNRIDIKKNIDIILSGRTLNHVVKSIKKDGTLIYNSLYEKKVRINGYGDCILSIANNITQQIIAEKKLKEIEAKQRNILEHSNNVFYSHTTDHKITYISPQIKQLLDYEVEEAMVKWTDLATDNPMNQIGFEKTVKAINTGIPQAPYELELIGKKRKKVVVEVHEAPVVENGKTIGIVGALIDITEKKKAELALKEAKEQFQFAIEGSDVGLWDWQVQTGETVFNEKWASIIGYKLEEIYPMNIDTWANYTHPDDLQITEELLDRHFRGDTKTYEAEFRMRHKSGDWVWILDRGKVIEWDKEKKPIRMVGTHLDITERKNSSRIIKKYAQEIETFFSLSQNMIGNLNSSDIVKIIPQYIVNAMENVDASSLWQFNNEEKVFQPISWYGYENLDISNTGLSLADTLIGKIYTSQKGIICNNTLSEPSFKRIDTVNSSLIKSTIGLPLIVNEEIIGIVFSDNLFATNIFDEEDFKVLQSFVNFSAVAFNNAQLYDMLKKSEQKYHSIIDSIGESIVIHDFETHAVIDVNKKMLEMYGLSSEEALTVDLNDTSSGVYPYTREEAFKLVEKAKTEGPQLFEWHAKKKNGELFWTEINLRISKVGKEDRIISVIRDIDRRKKIEEAIKLSEAKTETIMRSAPVGIGFIKNRILQYVNKHLLTLLGYSEDEMVGHSSRNFYDTIDDFEKIGELYKQIETKPLASAEAKVRRKNGEVIDLIIGLSPIDRNDIEKGVIFSALDITENKAAQKKIVAEEARYKNLFENSPVPLWEEDYSQIFKRLDPLIESGVNNLNEYFELNPSILLELSSLIKIIDVNKETLNLLCATDKSQLYDELPLIFTDNSLQILKELVITIFEGGTYFSSESEIKTLEGELRFVDLRLYLGYDTSADVNRYKGLLATIDITDRRLAELEIANQLNRNRTFLNTMNDGFILTDDQGNIVDVNNSYCNLVGYTAEELMQMNIREIDVLIPTDEVDRRIKQMISKGSDTFNTKHKTKEDKIIDLAVNVAVNTFEDKTLITCFVRDITLQNMALEELNKSREEIGELAQHLQEIREDERQSIAAEIHDDLGQALTALKLDTSILLSKISAGDEAVATKLKSMKDLADQSIKTVQKISSDLRPGILNDLGLTAALEWEINKFEERSGIRCNLMISPYDISFDDKVNISVFRLIQEACTNVLRHSKATKLEISMIKELTKLHLIIKDNGIGITSEQINNSKSFGLFGMRERLRNLRGGINFTGEPNKGTTVSIVIPLNNESKK